MNLVLYLLKLEWKSLFRSSNVGKSIGIKLFLGFLAIYFLFSFLGLGIGLYALLEKSYPDVEPILFVNSFLLKWFFGELIARYMLQNLPVADVKPLLVQNISRNKIIHFLLFKSSYSFFNILTMAVAIPFAIVNYNLTEYTSWQLLFWGIGILGCVYLINYLNLWIQRFSSRGVKDLIPFLVVIFFAVIIEYFKLYSFSNLFGSLFNAILLNPVLGLIPIGLAIVIYIAVFKDLKRNLYLDAYLSKNENNIEFSNLGWLDRFGDLALFIQLDLKLIARNKRAKNTALLSLFFLFYGLIFYMNDTYAENSIMFVFVGIFMTGMFIINFGQFIPAWDSSYFSLFRSQPVSMTNYLTSKVVLMNFSILILTVLSSFYAYFGWEKVYINLACAIYNAGVNIPIILFFSTYNRKRIDLSHSSMFNYQGIGIAQWLVGIPLLLIPIGIWGVVYWLGDFHMANLVLIGVGIVGILFHKLIIKVVARLYNSNKYKVLEGFNQKA